MRAKLRVVIACLAAGSVACSAADEPPGKSAGETAAAALPLPESAGEPAPPEPPRPGAGEADEPGHGARIASIAMRTTVHLAPSHRSTRLGYLRAGAVVERALEPAGDEGCAGGWYRIAPRGFVCVGRGASLAVDHDVALAMPRGPRRGEPFPYPYAISRQPPPTRYVRLPTRREQRRIEGAGPEAGASSWARRNEAELGPADALTPFLASGRDMPKPYGAEEQLRFPAHRGRARPLSAFGLTASFEWTGRRFGLTTELDLLPIDRTNVVHASSMRGIELSGEIGVPAFVMAHGIVKLRPDERGVLKPDGVVAHRSGWVLTGKAEGPDRDLVETTAGFWLPAASLRIADLRQDLWGRAKAGRRWIDVSLEKQVLVAYEGARPVYATLVSTGRGGTGDPEATSATVQGTFFIYEKHVTATMDGDEASDDAFDLHDVPYVQYFHKGYALHGAYWHDAFGRARSHGCVNLAPADAAWLFEFTDPPVPHEWHGASNPRGGTLVYIHR